MNQPDSETEIETPQKSEGKTKSKPKLDLFPTNDLFSDIDD